MAKYINKDLIINDTDMTLGDLANTLTGKVNSKKMIWGTSISLELEVGQMGLAIIGHLGIFQFWRNGNGIDYRLVSGESPAGVSISEDKTTITFSSDSAFAAAIFYI